MKTKNNPLKLNALQLKTLTLLQEMARLPDYSSPEDGGLVRITNLPYAHGDHFHLGDGVVSGADATGLRNEIVRNALIRKGLAVSRFPALIALTPAGLDYPTGMREAIIGGQMTNGG